MAPGICFPANEALLAASSTAAPTVTAAYRRTHADTFMTGSLFLFVRVETKLYGSPGIDITSPSPGRHKVTAQRNAVERVRGRKESAGRQTSPYFCFAVLPT